jgi:hypothetical protein
MPINSDGSYSCLEGSVLMTGQCWVPVKTCLTKFTNHTACWKLAQLRGRCRGCRSGKSDYRSVTPLDIGMFFPGRCCWGATRFGISFVHSCSHDLLTEGSIVEKKIIAELPIETGIASGTLLRK